MRLLLDHCVPVDLAPHIRGHVVASVRDLGWQAYDDGELIAAADGKFDVLLTTDTSMTYQQAVAGRSLSIVVMRVRINRVEHLARLVSALQRLLKAIGPGEVHEVS